MITKHPVIRRQTDEVGLMIVCVNDRFKAEGFITVFLVASIWFLEVVFLTLTDAAAPRTPRPPPPGEVSTRKNETLVYLPPHTDASGFLIYRRNNAAKTKTDGCWRREAQGSNLYGPAVERCVGACFCLLAPHMNEPTRHIWEIFTVRFRGLRWQAAFKRLQKKKKKKKNNKKKRDSCSIKWAILKI